MRRALNKEEVQIAEWRKRCFNQEVFFFESTKAVMTVDADGNERICIADSHFRTMDEWAASGETYCVDAGLGWTLYGVREALDKIREEIFVARRKHGPKYHEVSKEDWNQLAETAARVMGEKPGGLARIADKILGRE